MGAATSSPPTDGHSNLADALKATFVLFNETARHTAGFVLIALGWLIAEDQGTALVVGEGLVKFTVEIVLVTLLGVQVATLGELWKRNCDLSKRVTGLGRDDPLIVAYCITTAHGVSSIAVIVLLFAALLVVVWVIGGYVPTRG